MATVKHENVGDQPAAAGLTVVALAASAGGLNALSHVLAALPVDFPAAVVIVQHLWPLHRSLMASILSRRTRLPVEEAHGGDVLRPGAVFIAPADHHLLVNPDGTLSLSHAALVHGLRPSADVLFESLAESFRDRAIAVVLSGTGTDGTAGLQAIKRLGGMVLAQDEHSAEHAGMPQSAIRTGLVDRVVPLDDIGPTLVSLIPRASAS